MSKPRDWKDQREEGESESDYGKLKSYVTEGWSELRKEMKEENDGLKKTLMNIENRMTKTPQVMFSQSSANQNAAPSEGSAGKLFNTFKTFAQELALEVGKSVKGAAINPLHPDT